MIDNGGARHMTREKTIHDILGNRANGIIKGVGKLVNPGRETILLKKGSTANVISMMFHSFRNDINNASFLPCTGSK